MLDPKIDLKNRYKDSIDEWSKTFCLRAVHNEAKKLVSNNVSVEFYDELIDGKILRALSIIY